MNKIIKWIFKLERIYLIKYSVSYSESSQPQSNHIFIKFIIVKHLKSKDINEVISELRHSSDVENYKYFRINDISVIN